MKTLYMLRHGLAVERGTKGYNVDSRRPLTPEGRRKMRRIARTLRKLELSFDIIFSSPYVRARQTAEIVAKAFKAEERISDRSELALPSRGNASWLAAWTEGLAFVRKG